MADERPPEITDLDQVPIDRSIAEAAQEMKAAVLLAKHFPRDLTQVWGKVSDMCRRKTFAVAAEYNFPRGGGRITGPSVKLARSMASVFGNVHYGFRIVKDESNSRQIEGFAWDLETGTKVTSTDYFQKLIYRKDKGWIEADERELRELTNRRGAIAVRNAVLQLLPFDLVEDAIAQCHQTQTAEIKDPKGEQKKLIRDFVEISVTVEMIQKYLKHSEAWSPEEIVHLRGVYNAIKDGEAKRTDYFALKPAEDNGKTATQNLEQELSARAGTETVEGEQELTWKTVSEYMDVHPVPVEVSDKYTNERLQALNEKGLRNAFQEIKRGAKEMAAQAGYGEDEAEDKAGTGSPPPSERSEVKAPSGSSRTGT